MATVAENIRDARFNYTVSEAASRRELEMRASAVRECQEQSTLDGKSTGGVEIPRKTTTDRAQGTNNHVLENSDGVFIAAAIFEVRTCLELRWVSVSQKPQPVGFAAFGSGHLGRGKYFFLSSQN